MYFIVGTHLGWKELRHENNRIWRDLNWSGAYFSDLSAVFQTRSRYWVGLIPMRALNSL